MRRIDRSPCTRVSHRVQLSQGFPPNIALWALGWECWIGLHTMFRLSVACIRLQKAPSSSIELLHISILFYLFLILSLILILLPTSRILLVSSDPMNQDTVENETLHIGRLGISLSIYICYLVHQGVFNCSKVEFGTQI